MAYDAVVVKDPLTEMVNVHDPKLCEGRGCSVHHPSDHHMKDWTRVWRPSKGMFELQCPHGVGHPDPDDVAYYASIGQTHQAVHGCDGCCNPDGNLLQDY